MTTKYDNFVLALRELCVAHKVQLSTSGYDAIQVWNLNEGDDPLYGGDPDNRFEEDAPK